MTESNPAPRVSTQWQTLLGWLLFVAFLGAIQYYIGWSTLWQDWQQLPAKTLLTGLALILLSYAVRAWRLLDFFPELPTRKGLQTLKVTLQSRFYQQFGFPRQGKTQLPFLLHQQLGLPYPRAQSAYLWFRFLDLHTLLCFAFYPLLVITPLKRLAIPIVLVWMLIPLLIYLFRKPIRRGFTGKTGKLSEWAQKTLYALPDQASAFWRCWLLTWGMWVIYFIALVLVLRLFLPDYTINVLIGAIVAGELTLLLWPFRLPANVIIYETAVSLALMPFLGFQAALIAAVSLHIFLLLTAALGELISLLIPSGS